MAYIHRWNKSTLIRLCRVRILLCTLAFAAQGAQPPNPPVTYPNPGPAAQQSPGERKPPGERSAPGQGGTSQPRAQRPPTGKGPERNSFPAGWSGQLQAGAGASARRSEEAASSAFDMLSSKEPTQGQILPIAGLGVGYGFESLRLRPFLALGGEEGDGDKNGVLAYGLGFYPFNGVRLTVASGVGVLKNRVWAQPYLEPYADRKATDIRIDDSLRLALGLFDLLKLSYTTYRDHIEDDQLGTLYPVIAREGRTSSWEVNIDIPLYVPSTSARATWFTHLRHTGSRKRARGEASSYQANENEIGIGYELAGDIVLVSGSLRHAEYDTANPYPTPTFFGIVRDDKTYTVALNYQRKLALRSTLLSGLSLITYLGYSYTTSNIAYYNQQGGIGLFILQWPFGTPPR